MPSDKDIVQEARELASHLAAMKEWRSKKQVRTEIVLRTLADEVERLRERFSVTCNECGERYLGPKDDTMHGYNICNMSRCED